MSSNRSLGIKYMSGEKESFVYVKLYQLREQHRHKNCTPKRFYNHFQYSKRALSSLSTSTGSRLHKNAGLSLSFGDSTVDNSKLLIKKPACSDILTLLHITFSFFVDVCSTYTSLRSCRALHKASLSVAPYRLSTVISAPLSNRMLNEKLSHFKKAACSAV